MYIPIRRRPSTWIISEPTQTDNWFLSNQQNTSRFLLVCLAFITQRLSSGKQHPEEQFTVFRENWICQRVNAVANVENGCISTVIRTLRFAISASVEVAEITGLGKNVIKEIDKKRLQEKYTIDGQKLIKPERQAKYLGIDEFKLHDGHRYATHIIDMETGHILWIAKGKTKQVVYDFIEHVGMDWMEGVEAIACDMNSDFQEAFEDTCEWIQPVFDYFHIVKDFNDKVVSEIRKAEQRRLYEEGNIDAAKALKKTRYILTSNRSTLRKKDEEAAEGKILHKGSTLFKTEDVVRKGGHEARYDELLLESKLLFTVDLIKEKLADAYRMTDEAKMADKIIDIMDVCEATGNTHLLWFRKLLDEHFEGVVAHAAYQISAGKIEGINQRIKTLRRHGYGYPDDEYFFLKLFDMSRQGYVRNVPSHRISD